MRAGLLRRPGGDKIAGMRLAVLLIPLLVAVHSPAVADGDLAARMTARDKAKLADYEATRAKALAEARASGSAADVATLDSIMSPAPISVHGGVDLSGLWRCRTIKLGKTDPRLIVYGWFNCRISEDGAGPWLDKTTGSQRTKGLLYDASDTRMIYLGALYYSDEKPRLYGADPQRDQAAYVYLLSKDRMRLEFPAPEYESLMDVLELKRN